MRKDKNLSNSIDEPVQMKYFKTFGGTVTKSHRAVAPIIATLLMVAIAVVGGVLIYVYTQGFFASTSTTTVSTDVITMTGYDAKGGVTIYDGSSVTPSTSAGCVPDTGASTNGKTSTANECITIHVRNAGGAPVAISGFKIDGLPIANNGTLNSGKWVLFNPSISSLAEPTIQSGKEATLVYKISTTIPQDAPITIEVGTKGGSQFTFKLTEGLRK